MQTSFEVVSRDCAPARHPSATFTSLEVNVVKALSTPCVVQVTHHSHHPRRAPHGSSHSDSDLSDGVARVVEWVPGSQQDRFEEV